MYQGMFLSAYMPICLYKCVCVHACVSDVFTLLHHPLASFAKFVHIYAAGINGWSGVALTRKNCVFYAKKEQATQIWNAVRLLYAKNSDLTHQMRLVFSFFAPSREGL